MWAVFHLAVTGPLTLRPDAGLSRSIALAHSFPALCTAAHMCPFHRHCSLVDCLFSHSACLKYSSGSWGWLLCVLGYYMGSKTLWWGTVEGGWRNPSPALSWPNGRTVHVSRSLCPVVLVTQTTLCSVAPVKGCEWLQAAARTWALFLFNLPVQRCWSVLSFKGGPRYPKWWYLVSRGYLTLCRLQLHQKFMACVSQPLAVSHWSSHTLLWRECSPVPPGLGAEGSQRCSQQGHCGTCSPSLPLGLPFWWLLISRGQARSPQNIPLHYKIQVQLVYSAYVVHENLIEGVKRGAGLKKCYGGYPSWD